MKTIILLMLFFVSVAASAGSSRTGLVDGGGPIPTCYPGTPQCPNGSSLKLSSFDGGGPIPTCFPGKICK
ncbi:MAG TPA: hypothetical protein VFB79_04640 [Candidatus Angelobacter sp.]|nr:hypothetical protein [Candidatus Angelobacter sp.]